MADFSHLRRLQSGPVSKAAGDSEWATFIDELANDFEPQLAAAFRRAAQRLSSEIEIEQLAEAIRTGNLIEIDTSVGLSPDSPAFSELWPPLQSVMREAGTAASLRFAKVQFNLLNPHTEAFFQTYGMGLIKQISEETRSAIHSVVAQGVLNGQGPAETARAIRHVVGYGLTSQQAQAVANYTAELSTLEGGALDRKLRDHRYDPRIRRAIEEQTPLSADNIRSMAGAYEHRMGMFRAQMIARTESIRAANAGAHESIKQAVDSGAIPAGGIRRFWLIAGRGDDRVCPVCRAIARDNSHGVGFDEPFRTATGSTLLPPQHPGCRCAVSHRLDVS